MADSQPSKACKRCHEVKPLSEFSAERLSPDGKRYECRPCRAILYREYKAKNPDVVRATQRASYAKNKAKIRVKNVNNSVNNRVRNRDNQRRRRAAGLVPKRSQADRLRQNARYYAKYPEKFVAHRAVAVAVRTGRLIKPKTCSKCGAGGWIQASHDDYTKPLQIEWLCVKCHRIKDAAAYAPKD